MGSSPPSSPGVTVGLAIPTPWRGSRGHRKPRPGSCDWARERRRWEGRGQRETKREIRPGLADPGAGRQMVLRQLDGLGQRRRAVALDPLGRSPLVPRSGSVDGAAQGSGRRVEGWPALGLRRPGGLRQATVGLLPALPPSTVGSGAPTTGCAPSHTPPLSFQRGPRRLPGHRGVPSSSAGCGRSMGLRRGFPPGLASSGWPAGLHPAPGPIAGSDLPAPASCP